MSVDSVSTTVPTTMPVTVGLDDERGRESALVGAKAAALGRARAAGLPALPGFAITVTAAAHVSAATATGAALDELHRAWSHLSVGGAQPLVVRSSAVDEDGEASSMAGRFTSVLDVRGWDAFLAAVADVVRSAGELPMGVLVQPFLVPAWGGVLFGADPVTGRADRLVVSAVEGGPDRLVGGQVDGVQFTLSPRGRLRQTADAMPSGLRKRSVRHALAGLAGNAAAVFGTAQDIEWAIDGTGRIVLLQSRPITAIGRDVAASGPLLGPGPVAETFPYQLSALEDDLWVAPLRDGLREALRIVGTASPRRLRRSPVVVVVDGWVAADLDLLGIAPSRHRVLSRLNPFPPARRLKAAWRVGRLKVALPALAADVLDEVDRDLRSLPDLDALPADQLVHLLRRSHQTLVALNGYEILAGLLLDEQLDTGQTAASAALRVLAAERGATSVASEPLSDDELVGRHPVLLTLVPPRIGGAIQLPPPPASPPPAGHGGGEVSVRESLRLRVRWIHEVTARAVLVLGRQLAERGALDTAADVAALSLPELAAIIDGGGAPVVDLRERRRTDNPATPLPALFRLSEDGLVCPVTDAAGRGARGAGGGRGTGPVHVGADTPPTPGSVLVVRTLDPALAGLLPTLAGLVAETGSVLSHLAILAREYGVPTVVGVQGATTAFGDGTWVLVDGSTGEVSPLDDSEWRAA
jgi:pyruvate,water dikinase